MASHDQKINERLIGDLPHLQRYKIERSKAARLNNRAELMRTHQETLPPHSVPAMIPPACLDNLGSPLGKPFSCHIQDARINAGKVFETIHASTADRKSHVWYGGVSGAGTDKSREFAAQSDREWQVMQGRLDKFPDINEEKTSGPIPGDESPGTTKTKFIVILTADADAQTIDAFLDKIGHAAKALTNGTAAPAFLTQNDLSAPYITAPPMPGKTVRIPDNLKAMSPDALHQYFEDIVGPIDGKPSFWATQAYLVLDAQSVQDQRTCMLVAETAGAAGQRIVERQRAEAEVALAHLMAAEMGEVSLGQAARAEDLQSSEDVLTLRGYEDQVRKQQETREGKGQAA